MRLGGALESLEGLASANATLMGQLTLAWDDERLERARIIETLRGAGFEPAEQE
jgi:hypothetical protein